MAGVIAEQHILGRASGDGHDTDERDVARSLRRIKAGWYPPYLSKITLREQTKAIVAKRESWILKLDAALAAQHTLDWDDIRSVLRLRRIY